MKYLFGRWEQVKRKLSDKRLLLFFDYDGTLTPIARTPQQASISKKVKGLLRKVSRKPDCTLAIISGRALKNIKRIVGLGGIIYAGNHGLEIDGPKIKFKSQVSPRIRLAMRDIAEELPKRLSGIKGVLIEDKGLTLSVHYRLVGKKDMPAFREVISGVISPYIASGKIKVNAGKKVYEIKPPVKWDKGKVALWLLERQQFLAGADKVLPVYFGDDTTDEDGFRALNRKGLTIFVGQPKASAAAYFVRNTGEVTRFIKQVLELG